MIFLFCILLFTGITSITGFQAPEEIDEIISGMTLDEKISQMIIPVLRSWNGENVTDLDAV